MNLNIPKSNNSIKPTKLELFPIELEKGQIVRYNKVVGFDDKLRKNVTTEILVYRDEAGSYFEIPYTQTKAEQLIKQNYHYLPLTDAEKSTLEFTEIFNPFIDAFKGI